MSTIKAQDRSCGDFVRPFLTQSPIWTQFDCSPIPYEAAPEERLRALQCRSAHYDGVEA
jgi:hypothetical protein